MDHKYIEQLLERYWACTTSPAEEEILRLFFSQPDVPAQLARYKALFEYQREAAAPRLGDDFDRRVCALVEQASAAPCAVPVVKVRRIGLAPRLRPLYHAAASVAIVVLLGTAAQHSFNREENAAGWDYNSAAYTDTYQNPQEAYEAGIEALSLFSTLPDSAKSQPEGIVQPTDSDR